MTNIKNDSMVLYDSYDLHKQYSPASTFKILNSLIALQTKVIKDENTIIKWDSIDRSYEPWNRDQDMKMAFANSTGPTSPISTLVYLRRIISKFVYACQASKLKLIVAQADDLLVVIEHIASEAVLHGVPQRGAQDGIDGRLVIAQELDEPHRVVAIGGVPGAAHLQAERLHGRHHLAQHKLEIGVLHLGLDIVGQDQLEARVFVTHGGYPLVSQV